MMRLFIAAFIGALYGAFSARRKNMSGLDQLHRATIMAIAFLLIFLIINITLSWRFFV